MPSKSKYPDRRPAAPPQKGGGRPSLPSLQQAQRALNDRQLQFAAWLSLPERSRNPKTHREFAALIGVHEITLFRWAKDPAIQMATRWLVLHNAGDPLRISRVVDFLFEASMDESLPHRTRLDFAREFLSSVGVKQTWTMDNRLLKQEQVEDIDLQGLTDEEVWELFNTRAIEAGLPDAADEVGFSPIDETGEPSGDPESSESPLEGSVSDENIDLV